MAEVKKLAGGDPTPSEILVNVDNTTIKGDGSRNFPLHAVGGVASIPTVFPYTVKMGDTDTITVPIPGGRPDTNYLAYAFGLSLAAFLEFQTPQVDYTTTSLVVKCNAAPTIGDVIGIIIAERTA